MATQNTTKYKPFGSGTYKPFGSGVEVKQAENNPLNNIINFGQGVIDVLSTPMYFVEGALAKTADKKVQKKNPLEQIWAAIEAGGNNATAWTRGERPIAGAEFVKAINPDFGKNETEKFWGGLIADVALDPLSYVSGSGLIKYGIKAPLEAGKAAAKAIPLAAKGTVAATAAARKATTPALRQEFRQALRTTSTPLAPTKQIIPAKLARTPYQNEAALLTRDVAAAEGKRLTPIEAVQARIAEQQIGAETKIQKGFTPYKTETPTGKLAYTTVNLGKGSALNGPGVAFASAMEAAKKQFATTIITENARRAISKASAQEGRLIRKGNAESLSNEIQQLVIQAPKFAEDVTTKGDEAAIKMDNGTTEVVKPDTVFVAEDGTAHVYDGKNIRTFDTAADANTYLDNRINPPKVRPTVAGRPLLDSAPSTRAIKQMAAVAKPSEETKIIRQMLTKLDSIAKKSDITVASGAELAAKAREILTSQKAEVLNFIKGLRPDIQAQIKYAIAADGTDAFALLRKFGAPSADGQAKSVGKLIADLTITVDGKTDTILDIMRQGVEYSKLDAGVRQAIRKALEHQFIDMLNPANVKKYKLAELTKLLGADKAAEIAKLKGPEIQQFLTDLANSQATTGKKYSGFDHLLAGLNSGDTVPMDTLDKILKAIDPERKFVNQVGVAASKDTAQMLTKLIVNEGSQLVTDARRRLMLLNAETILKADGLALHETVSSYLSLRMSGEMPPAGNAVVESRQDAAAALYKMYDQGGIGAARLRRGLDSLSTAVDKRMDFIDKLLAEKGQHQIITSFGDAAILSTEKAFQDGSRAALNLQTNQSFEATLAGSVFALMRYDADELAKAAKGKPYVKRNEVDEFIARMDVARQATLTFMGSRLMSVKTIARGVKDQTPHYVYVDMGDFANILKDTGAEDIFRRAFIPNTKTPSDSFSYIGVMDAVRMIIEARSKNIALDEDAIIKRLLSRGEGQKEWSPAFKKTTKQTAVDIYNHIKQDDVIKLFEDTHTARAVAEVEDNLGDVITMTEDVFNSLLDGFRANKRTMSEAMRVKMLREAFAKFAFASGFVLQKSGPQAEAMMKLAASMFIRDGRLANIDKVKGYISSTALPDEQAQLDQLLEMVNRMYRSENPNAAAPAGRELIPTPRADVKAKAEANLAGAESAYETHLKNYAEIKDTATAKLWETQYRKLQANLDKAREKAWYAHLETRHYDNGKWVPTNLYNHASAAQRAAKAAENKTLVQGRWIDGVDALTDSKPKIPQGKKLTIKQSQAFIADANKRAAQRAAELSDGAAQDAAQHALDVAPQLDAMMGDPFAAALRMEHERLWKRYENLDEQIDLTDAETLRYRQYGQRSKAQPGEEKVSGFERILERVNRTSGRKETQAVLAQAETKMFKAMASISAVTRVLGEELTKIDFTPFARAGEQAAPHVLRNRAFSEAFTIALRGGDIPEAYGADFAYLTETLTKLVDGVKEAINKLNMDPKIVERYLRKYGVNDIYTLSNPGKLKPNEMNRLIDDLPFIKPIDDGSREYDILMENKNAFDEGNQDPFKLFANVVNAISHAKTEQVFAHDFMSQFGYKARGLSQAQALKLGYVRVEGLSIENDLSAHLIGQEANGALFHPAIAKEFASLNREWQYMQSKTMSAFLRTAMDITGIFKASQTILRPGHVMTNVVGDATTAMIGGARRAHHWSRGIQVAMSYAKEKAGADGFMYFNGNIEKQLTAATNNLARLEGNATKELAIAANPIMHVAIGGKKVPLTIEDLKQMGVETGTLTDNMEVNDIQGLYESVVARSTETGARGNHAKEIEAKIRLGYEKAIKPAGDITAYYSNISRMATMISTIEKRSWKSMAEMKAAVTDKVLTYHPTMTSLSATERRYPRVMFTYYTWLRVAHNALIDMMLNHTAAVTLYPKIQYSAAEAEGREPVSIGNAWGSAKTFTPSYLTYSTYAPMGEQGPNGPVISKPSILPMDVLDNWNWTYDPYKTWDENISANFTNTGKTVGKSINLIAQPAVEWMTGRDLQTGQKTQIKDIGTLGESLIDMTGYATILKGIGAYTPTSKLPENTTNPLTDRDRQLMVQNWLFGLKRADIQKPANVQNALTEQSARMKQFMEWYAKQQETK